MAEFFDEKIEVVTARTSPRPVSFSWRGETHIAVEVLSERVDTGFGALSPASRRWFNRRHRRYYTVTDESGDVFDIYMDYAGSRKPTWWLVTKREKGEAP